MTQHSWLVLPPPSTWQSRPAETEGWRAANGGLGAKLGWREGAGLGIPRGTRRRGGKGSGLPPCPKMLFPVLPHMKTQCNLLGFSCPETTLAFGPFYSQFPFHGWPCPWPSPSFLVPSPHNTPHPCGLNPGLLRKPLIWAPTGPSPYPSPRHALSSASVLVSTSSDELLEVRDEAGSPFSPRATSGSEESTAVIPGFGIRCGSESAYHMTLTMFLNLSAQVSL